MKSTLRIALPPLAAFSAQSALDFVLTDREGALARAGTLTPAELVVAVSARRVEVILHPHDAVLAEVQLPPLTGPRLEAAVQGAVEPLALDDVELLAIAHGPRAPDGRVTVCWTNRAALARAWQTLAQAGLHVVALLPTDLILPPDDATPHDPLALPANARWLVDAPGWSLALPELQPQSAHPSRWRRPLIWCAAAAAVWIVGLNLYAGQRAREADGLRTAMAAKLRAAFPEIPVVVDPLRQAEQQRNALRSSQGTANDGDFLPLALAAAQALPFAATRVTELRYANEQLTLVLDDNDANASPLQSQVNTQAQTLGLTVVREDAGWVIRRAPPGQETPTAIRITSGTGEPVNPPSRTPTP